MDTGFSSHYKLLGIGPEADGEQIRSAFRRVSMICHPDKNDNSAESNRRYALIINAYKILSDESKRKHYDDYLRKSSWVKTPLTPRVKSIDSRNISVVSELLRYINVSLWEIDDLLKDSGIDARRGRLIMIILTFLDKWILDPAGFPDYFAEARGMTRRDPREYIGILSRGSRPEAHLPYSSIAGYYRDIRKRADRLITRFEKSAGLPELPLEAVLEYHNMSVHYMGYLLDDNVYEGEAVPEYVFSDNNYNYRN